LTVDYGSPRSFWVRHTQTTILLAGATAIILAAALFRLQADELAIAVALVGSAVTILWFRKTKPSAPLAGKRNRALRFVAIFYPLAAIALAVGCLIHGWRWWCPLLILPIWAGQSLLEIYGRELATFEGL